MSQVSQREANCSWGLMGLLGSTWHHPSQRAPASWRTAVSFVECSPQMRSGLGCAFLFVSFLEWATLEEDCSAWQLWNTGAGMETDVFSSSAQSAPVSLLCLAVHLPAMLSTGGQVCLLATLWRTLLWNWAVGLVGGEVSESRLITLFLWSRHKVGGGYTFPSLLNNHPCWAHSTWKVGHNTCNEWWLRSQPAWILTSCHPGQVSSPLEASVFSSAN